MGEQWQINIKKASVILAVSELPALFLMFGLWLDTILSAACMI